MSSPDPVIDTTTLSIAAQEKLEAANLLCGHRSAE
jgi:hypothetical protein